VIGPFSFHEKPVNSVNYLDMLELYAVPQLLPARVFQQDGAPPHWALHMSEFLNKNSLTDG
jgi:hypothetical protein